MEAESATLSTSDSGSLEEVLIDDGLNTEILVCAPHGGVIEPKTEDQARRVASLLGEKCSAWICSGTSSKSAFDEWHIPSTNIHPAQFPLLRRMVSRGFETVVSFHGCTKEKIFVGGRVSWNVKKELAERFQQRVDVPARATQVGSYAGQSRFNVVNWLADDFQGIQIEQGRNVREKYWEEIANAVVDHLKDGTLSN